MRRFVMLVAVVILVMAAFFFGRSTREPGPTVDRASTSMRQEARNAKGAAHTTAVPTDQTGSTTSHPDSAPSSQPHADDAGLSTHTTKSVTSAVGPQPLKPEDEATLAKVERVMRAEGGVGRDMLDLAEKEPQDDNALRLEDMLAQSIRRNGGNYIGLRLSPPHCTRSVCLLRAVGAGGAQNPRSDWQRLSGLVMSEPWFRNAFDDSRTMVGGEGADTVYITLFVRCAPGTCRFGKLAPG